LSKISLEGNVSGSGTLTIAAPNTNSNFTLSLPTNTGTIITQNSTPAFASTIGVGGATAAASGAGITFPATQSASSNANTLDDYEEGTWTPTISILVNITNATWLGGKYIKIGNLVTVQGRFSCTVTSSNALTYATMNLPFSSDGDQTGTAFANINLKVGACAIDTSGGGRIIPFFPAASAIDSGAEVIQVAATYMTT
jgi:hypothetical protein